MLPASTGIRDVVLQQIRDLAAQYGLCKVILFGSRATSKNAATSTLRSAAATFPALRLQ